MGTEYNNCAQTLRDFNSAALDKRCARDNSDRIVLHRLYVIRMGTATVPRLRGSCASSRFRSSSRIAARARFSDRSVVRAMVTTLE